MANKFSIAQQIYNENNYSESEMIDLLRRAESDDGELTRLVPATPPTDVRPVYAAVSRLSHGIDVVAGICSTYSEYGELFIDTMRDLVHTEAVVIGLDDSEPVGTTYGVSQRITGATNIACGIIASEDVFLQIAARYSGEPLCIVDELAIDSVTEYINVVNGLFAVELASRELETELTIPLWKKNPRPDASDQLKIKIATAFGTFTLVLAIDEFLGI